ncbi:MAG: DUF4412 domain-containing protein [Bacteroidota bacterium]
MYFIKIFVLTLSCVFLSGTLQAQERIKNRAENRANQRVDQKVDRAVDKAAGAIEGLFRRKKKNQEETPTGEPGESTSDEQMETDESAASDFLSRIQMGGEEFEPYQNPILMNLSLDMTTVDKKGKENKVSVHYTFDTWATGMVMVSEDNTARIILDNEEGYMTIISEDDGETQGMRMRQPVVDYDELVPNADSYTITDLGNTRVINGYNCREYLIEHEEGTSNIWVTNDLDVDPVVIMKAMASQMGQRKNSNSSQAFYDMPGFPIESTTVSSNGKETVTARYYDIKIGNDIDKGVFDTTGINIMSMGF